MAFAEMGKGACKIDKEACAAQIKTLRDSAAALSASNPDLAKELEKMKKEKHKKGKWKEKEESK